MLKKLMGIMSSAVLVAALVPAAALAEAVSAGEYPQDGAQTGELLAPVGSGALLQVQAVLADYSWYDPDQSTYTLASPDQVLGFANLVNGLDGKAAVDFKGKTVNLSSSSYAFQNTEWTPVGDASHPFQGAFNGNGATLNNFKVSGATRSAYLGFFGYVGSSGSVSGVSVGSGASVSVSRDASSSDVIHHVAGVAGFCGGTMSNCANSARVTVNSAVKQTASAKQPVYAIGGVAGECTFDMTGCTNVGALEVRQTSDPVGSVDDSGLVHFVGGVVGILGDSTRVGTFDGAIAADPAKHGSLSNCANRGKITVDTPSEAGTDRFGVTTFARSVCVGGVAGYSQGSMTGCVNGSAAGSTASDNGYVFAAHATSAGGIVGSLRGLIGSDNPTTRSSKDDGMAGNGADRLLLSNCTNYGDIYALNAVGGIAGYAGTYTTIKGCVNSNRDNGDTWVVATRWNKPAPAGIVGSTCGDVAFCANLGKVASGTWANESQRTISQASGYYAAGIAGMLSYYSEVNSTTQATEILSPIPEVYGCYNAGSILAVSGMRQRGIVGENEGVVHHCALLSGTVENDKISYGDDPADSEAHGVVRDCTVYTAAELKGGALGDGKQNPISLMNASASTGDYQSGFYWAKSTAATATGHYGYPVLSTSSAAPTGSTSIAGGTATVVEPARYNGGVDGNEAVPSVQLVVGGATLQVGLDYYVVPQPGAVEVSSGKPYKATLMGIGAYSGSIADVAYDIGKGYLSECTVTVAGATFNYNVQYPDASAVTVKTVDGVEILPDEYEIAGLVDSKGNATTTPTNRGNYTLTVRVREGSSHFDTSTKNAASGTYRISPADIMRVIDFSKVTILYNGKTYPWVSSSDEKDVDNPRTTIPFTGNVVNPTVSSISYNGHTLVENVDYRIVYGNPNSGEGDTQSHDLYNMGKRYGRTVGCVTVRFVTNSNFSNYVNMFFNITDDREAPAPVPMHRLYNPNSGEHFYTADEGERDSVVAAGWKYEGVGWTAPSTSWNPVYRLYNKNGGEHHYTLDADERDMLVRVGWNDEGIGWYSDENETVPLYRQYNPNAFSCNHNYTTSKEENDWLVSLGWKDEGYAWYGVK